MTDTDRLGTVLAGKYRLDEELGRGGMGVVYRAFHVGVHKQLAVKILTAEVAGKKKVVDRFLLEAQAASRIGHAGILDVYDTGEDDDGRPFLVMELLEGEPLAKLIRRAAPVDPELASWIALQLLEILEAAHRAGVVHRDVKPQNVFVVREKTLKLLDFGIAKFHLDPDVSAITGTGEVLGSPLYMAPEQAVGESDIDGRVDVWAVGMMLFEMLTGKPAHLGTTAAAVITKILTEVAPAPSSKRASVPRALDAIVGKALVIDREARFGSAREMREALVVAREKCGWVGAADFAVVRESGREREREGEPPLTSGRTTAGAGTTGTSIRQRKVWAVGAVVVLAMGAVLPWVVWGRREEKRGETGDRRPATGAFNGRDESASPSASESASASASSSASASGSGSAGVGAADAGRMGKNPCPGGERLSAGHCCPANMVWQAGRCEKPLATTF